MSSPSTSVRPVDDTITYPLPTSDDLAETVRLVAGPGPQDSRAARSISAPWPRSSRSSPMASAQFGRLDVVIANAGVLSWGRLFEMSRRSVGQRDRRQPVGYLAHHPGGGAGDDRSRERRLDRHRQLLGGAEGRRRATATTAASKFGLVGLTNALALEVGEFGIRVNSIHPYSIDTPMIEPEAMAAIFTKYPQYLHSFAPMPYKPVAHDGAEGCCRRS